MATALPETASRLRVAEILKTYAADFVAQHPRQAGPQVQSTLAKLTLCRTAALGGRTLHCTSCAHRCAVYNSCGDRHCPRCRGARRAEWVESTRALLLPGVAYFQVVFTLPQELSSLALGNRRTMYHLLFTAAWRALRETIETQCGFEPAALLVLHTWNQRLGHHPHVHALVPGGGPARDGRRWINSRHPKHRRRRKPYLVDNHLLSARFRQLFLAGLKKLHKRRKLRLAHDPVADSSAEQFPACLTRLADRDWVVYIEAPPKKNNPPEQVLKYLARYLTGGPISDQRIIAHTGARVTIAARSSKKPTGGERPRSDAVTLSGVEFTRRWSLHILPRHFTKVRRYGGFSNRRRAAYLERCRERLSIPAVAEEVQRPVSDAHLDAEPPHKRCPHCSTPMQCVLAAPRPGWLPVMTGPYRPYWYRE